LGQLQQRHVIANDDGGSGDEMMNDDDDDDVPARGKKLKNFKVCLSV
jgi:hypothetical protein